MRARERDLTLFRCETVHTHSPRVSVGMPRGISLPLDRFTWLKCSELLLSLALSRARALKVDSFRIDDDGGENLSRG